MNEKLAFKSKTIIGAIIAFLPSLITFAGGQVDPEAMAALEASADSALSMIWKTIDQMNELIGAFLIVWGRFTATSKLRIL